MQRQFNWCALTLAGALLVTGSAVAQEMKSKSKEAAPAVAMNVKAGDTMSFRRTLERSAVCEALGRDGEDKLVQEYTVKVAEVTANGGVIADVAFGHVTGHSKLSDGSKLDLDSSAGLPETEATRDKVMTRAITMLGGAEVKVTFDARGHVVAQEGVIEAVKKAFAGTPVEGMVADYPDSEAFRELQAFFPPLPAADVVDGGEWADEGKIDFGSRSKFGYQRTWKLAVDGETVNITAACEHDGSGAPDGQTNVGTGKVECARSNKDGFVTKQITEATFEGRGKFDIDTKFVETIERLPAE